MAASIPFGSRRCGQRLLACTARWTLLIALVGVGNWSGTAAGQGSATPSGRPTMRPLDPEHPETYREVLIFGLRAKLPSELEFVDSVVVAVEEGKLPSRLVDQTYFWARARSGSNALGRSNRPIIYFIPALEARVKKLHLNVELAGGLP
ncbi:MAG: hypothetical protein AB7G28_03200 [Pirellulales bacterium]